MIAGGVLIELGLVVATAPFLAAGRIDAVAMVIVPATLVIAALGGAWAARGTSAPALNGALTGVAAFVLYAVLALAGMLAAPEQADFDTALSPPYLGSHLCKLLGAALGGWFVGRGRS